MTGLSVPKRSPLRLSCGKGGDGNRFRKEVIAMHVVIDHVSGRQRSVDSAADGREVGRKLVASYQLTRDDFRISLVRDGELVCWWSNR